MESCGLRVRSHFCHSSRGYPGPTETRRQVTVAVTHCDGRRRPACWQVYRLWHTDEKLDGITIPSSSWSQPLTTELSGWMRPACVP